MLNLEDTSTPVTSAAERLQEFFNYASPTQNKLRTEARLKEFQKKLAEDEAQRKAIAEEYQKKAFQEFGAPIKIDPSEAGLPDNESMMALKDARNRFMQDTEKYRSRASMSKKDILDEYKKLIIDQKPGVLHSINRFFQGVGYGSKGGDMQLIPHVDDTWAKNQQAFNQARTSEEGASKAFEQSERLRGKYVSDIAAKNEELNNKRKQALMKNYADAIKMGPSGQPLMAILQQQAKLEKMSDDELFKGAQMYMQSVKDPRTGALTATPEDNAAMNQGTFNDSAAKAAAQQAMKPIPQIGLINKPTNMGVDNQGKQIMADIPTPNKISVPSPYLQKYLQGKGVQGPLMNQNLGAPQYPPQMSQSQGPSTQQPSLTPGTLVQTVVPQNLMSPQQHNAVKNYGETSPDGYFVPRGQNILPDGTPYRVGGFKSQKAVEEDRAARKVGNESAELISELTNAMATNSTFAPGKSVDQAVLGNPMQKGMISGLLDKLQPNKLGGVGEFGALAKKLLDMAQTGKEDTAALKAYAQNEINRLFSTYTKDGKATPESQFANKFASGLASILSDYSLAISGKVINNNEMQRFQQRFPTILDSPENTMDLLVEFSTMNRIRKQLLDLGYNNDKIAAVLDDARTLDYVSNYTKAYTNMARQQRVNKTKVSANYLHPLTIIGKIATEVPGMDRYLPGVKRVTGGSSTNAPKTTKDPKFKTLENYIGN